jgi:hypothetical protein
MKRFSEKIITERDEYLKTLLLKYLMNKKMITLAELITKKLDIKDISEDKLIEIKECIRDTFEVYETLKETSTYYSLRSLLKAEYHEE